MEKKFETLKEIIISVTDSEIEEISPTDNLRDDIGCDSIEVMEIIVDVENHFKIEFTDEEAERES